MLHRALVILLAAAPLATGTEGIDFRKDVAPILEANCLGCHSDSITKGDLSLTTFAGLMANAFVVAGRPDESHLVEVISSVDGERARMPEDGPPLSDEDVTTIRRWIEEGAHWPKDVVLREKSKADTSWWSLQALSEVSLPAESTSIDLLVVRKLDAAGLRRNKSADKRELIRRATYDLTGLPPTPAQVEAFVAGTESYEQLIDRLLASPQYGERWGRHWLDVVRFGESNGFERNVIINDLWPFRDYVIQSINDDKPFDQFIREHIAGDVIGKDQPDIEVGSAFLVAGPYDNVGNSDAIQAAQIRADTIDEMIRSTSEAFLGLTIGCARCHDHKFDPILQSDYYSMYATFAGVRHGRRQLGTREAKAERAKKLKPLQQRKTELEKQRQQTDADILARGRAKLVEFESKWLRPPTNRKGTEERFAPVDAKFVRLVCEAQDGNPNARSFRIDEFEIFSADEPSTNVALASNGAIASGPARQIQDFPGAYDAHLTIDGKFGSRFISASDTLTIQLAKPTRINRVFFSSARQEVKPEHRELVFVADYRIEVSLDGKEWEVVATGADRKPVSVAHRDGRLRKAVTTADDRRRLAEMNRELGSVNQQLAALPQLKSVWVGRHNESEAKGPFHVFLGGSPQRKGDAVAMTSLAAFSAESEGTRRPTFLLKNDVSEAQRRVELANWISSPANPLTLRVLANRVWHYHFGRGLVDTPSDFGYMGGRPTHPELLNWLAVQLRDGEWKLKQLHRLIMLSQTYQQSSKHNAEAAKVDGDSRLLWRFPPRRLSAEEIRDTILSVAGKLDSKMGGPGFRLYEYQQDNVATYVPLDKHGPETYRRAVYHQNARASVVDLMTDFDQPDCAFSTPRRAETTTPLQALTMLNHQFTLDMATAFADRLKREADDDPKQQIQRAFALCYSRKATDEEVASCQSLVGEHGLTALCRVLLNTGELIYVR